MMLPVLMVVYGLASLAHSVHNATYIRDYPNLPGWITPVGVYAAWAAIAAVGVVGYWVYRRGSRGVGLAIIALYALLGFGGLDHYLLAPVGAHTFAMNASIVVEVVAAGLLLVYVAYSAAYRRA